MTTPLPAKGGTPHWSQTLADLQICGLTSPITDLQLELMMPLIICAGGFILKLTANRPHSETLTSEEGESRTSPHP